MIVRPGEELCLLRAADGELVECVLCRLCRRLHAAVRYVRDLSQLTLARREALELVRLGALVEEDLRDLEREAFEAWFRELFDGAT